MIEEINVEHSYNGILYKSVKEQTAENATEATVTPSAVTVSERKQANLVLRCRRQLGGIRGRKRLNKTTCEARVATEKIP